MLPQLPPSLIWSDRPKGVADGPHAIERLSVGEGGADVVQLFSPLPITIKHRQLEGRGHEAGWKGGGYAHFQGLAENLVQDRTAQGFRKGDPWTSTIDIICELVQLLTPCRNDGVLL